MLDALLDRWREGRTVELADAIDRATGAAVPLDGKTVAARHAAWLAIADAAPDAEAVGRLVATPMPGPAAMRAQVIDRLLALADDPRVAMAIVRCFDNDWLPVAGFRTIARRALERLVALRDARVIPRMRAFLGRARRTNLEPAWLARLEALAIIRLPSAIEPPPPDRLYDALVAQPDDLAAYAVYADDLTQRGDPRGEFIALQLATEPDEANLRRQRELLAVHGRAWAGVLDRYFLDEGRVFERGMFAGGRLAPDPDIDLRHPAWAFVHTLEAFPHTAAGTATLLARGAPSVVRAGVFSLETGARLASGEVAPQLPGLRELHVDARGAADLDERLATCSALPNLEVLGLRNQLDAAPWIMHAPVLDRVRRLVVMQATLTAWLCLAERRSPTLREIEIVPAYTLAAHDEGWRIVLRRTGERGPFDDVAAEHAGADPGRIYDLVSLLERIPSDWPRRIVVRGRTATMAQHADELARFERVIARFTRNPTVAVPFARALRDSTPACVLHAQVPKLRALDAERFPIAWRALAELDQHYATFTVNKSSTQRPLGKDPLARVLGWIAKGQLDSTVLRDPRGESRARLAQSDASTFTLALPSERTPLDACAWFVDFLAQTGAPTGALGAEPRTFPLAVDGHVDAPPTAWFMVFDARARALLATQTVGELAALAPLATLDLADAHATVRVGDDPDAVTPARLAAVSAALVACFERGFARLHGFSFRERAIAAFAPLVAHYGLEPRTTHARAVGYHQVDGAALGLLAELAVDGNAPLLTASAYRFPPPPHRAPSTEVVSALPVTTAAELDAALAHAVARIAEIFAA